MTIVSTTKQINRSPEQVRRVVRRYLYNYPANDQLLDFAKMPEWTQGFIRSIEPAVKKNTIEEGDKLNVTLEGASFSPVVLENSPRQFKWRGSIPLLFHGDHCFRFDDGPTPGTTTLTHSEEFSGPLTFILKLVPQGTKQKDGFEGFNTDLKNRVESSV